MKRIILSTALVLAMGDIASAQTIIPGNINFDYSPSVSFPTEFSYDGKPRLMLWDDSDQKLWNIYDENLNKVKNVNMKSLSFDYQLDVKTEEREIKSVDVVADREGSTYSYNEFLWSNMNFDPRFSEDCLIFTNLDNGDQRVDIDYSKLSESIGSYYYMENYFGNKYPHYYYIKHGDVITQHYVQYDISYTDWVDKGTTTESYTEELRPLRLENLNLNNNDTRLYMRFYLSQTLFNSDESYEYLVPKYKLVEGTYSGGTSIVDPSRIELTRSTVVSKKASLALCGFQVVSEDGNVLQDLMFDNYLGGSYVNDPVVLTIGSNTYIAFDGRDSEGKSVTIFYKIDPTTSSIQKVRTVPGGMNLSSTIANKGADIQVNFSDNNEKGSEISVFSANGAKVKSLKVPAGQKTATFNVNGSAGMYLVNRAQNGKANETKKIVIK